MLRRSLVFIRRINFLLGYTRATIWHLRRFSQNWRRGEPIRVVDFATGSADVPQAICRWAERAGWDVRVVGLDLHAETARLAATESAGRIRIVRGDALNPPFADGAFDYAVCNMFLHHLPDDAVTTVLRQMNRVARRGVIVGDLLRHRRAYAWIKLLTLASNPMVKHDAAVSVAQAFRREEIIALRDAAGMSYAAYRRHFGHRFSLAGEKG